MYTGVKEKITLQEEYKYLNTNVLINTIIYVFKPHCAPKMSCLNKNNPNIPIVKEREWTIFKRKYFKCQDVQIWHSVCNFFLTFTSFLKLCLQTINEKALEISFDKKSHAWWVYTHGANDRRHKITISFSTVMDLWLLLDGYDYVLIKLRFYHAKTSLFWFWILM